MDYSKYEDSYKQFRSDLEDEAGIPHDAPYADELYQLAWVYGHANGYSEIASHYHDFAVLALKVARHVK